MHAANLFYAIFEGETTYSAREWRKWIEKKYCNMRAKKKLLKGWLVGVFFCILVSPLEIIFVFQILKSYLDQVM